MAKYDVISCRVLKAAIKRGNDLRRPHPFSEGNSPPPVRRYVDGYLSVVEYEDRFDFDVDRRRQRRRRRVADDDRRRTERFADERLELGQVAATVRQPCPEVLVPAGGAGGGAASADASCGGWRQMADERRERVQIGASAVVLNFIKNINL